MAGKYPKQGKFLSFKDAMELANRIGVKEEKEIKPDSVVLVLNNNDELLFKSHYDGAWSPDTPGEGIQTPTVTHKECACNEYNQRTFIGDAMWHCPVHGKIIKAKEVTCG